MLKSQVFSVRVGADELNDNNDPTHDIRVGVRTLEQHLAGGDMFYLPWFQRAYAWSEDHATRLLHDIIAAMRAKRRRYFLGQVMLAHKNGQHRAALIDGHQRTLTLTIIIALLRDSIANPDLKNRLDHMIRRPAAGTDAHFIVEPQETNADCFARFVQHPGATLLPFEDELDDLLESERNFLNNRSRLAQLFDEEIGNEDERELLAAFLLTRCLLTVQTIEDEEEAWEMLGVEETTGLAFHSSERSKVALITVMRRDLQEDAGRIWDLWQARLGAEGMAHLLRHIRALSRRKRTSRPIEQDLIQIHKLRNADLTFINDVVAPQAERYCTLKRAAAHGSNTLTSASASIRYLSWIGREFWVPPALQWLERYGENDPETPRFFAELDRLAWLLRIAGRDPHEQERHLLRIADNLGSGDKTGAFEELVIAPAITKAAVENLLSRTFYDKTYSRLVLRRLSLLLGRDSGAIDGGNATVEHVLPRRPAKGTDWSAAFPEKAAIDQHVHRLGNLAVLSFDDNQAAGSLGFDSKCAILAASKFLLAKDCAGEEAWTQETIMSRGRKLTNLLLEGWRLEMPTSGSK